MRNMSYAKTQRQIKERTKGVTRRLNWDVLKAGDMIRAVDRCMGFKKGEHPVTLAILRVTSTRWERLDTITQEECVLEGFPEMTPAEFVAMFCQMNKCQPDRMVNRIAFEYVDEPVEPLTDRIKFKLTVKQLSFNLTVEENGVQVYERHAEYST